MSEIPSVPLGERLRAGREQAGWSIEEVALKLRLSVAQVVALEEGNSRGLPSGPYMRGYARNYAQLLGWDLQEFLPRSNPPRDTPSLAPATGARGRIPWIPIAYLIFLAGIIGGVLWWHTHKAAQLGARLGLKTSAAQPGVVRALPPRLQLLTAPGASNGQLGAFPLAKAPLIAAPNLARLSAGTPTQAVQAPIVKRKPMGRSSPPQRVPKALTARGPTKEQRLGAVVPSRYRKPKARAIASLAPVPAIKVAPKVSAVPSPGGLISLPRGHSYTGLRISATTSPVRVSVRDAKGTRLLATHIAAGHSIGLVGRAPFHIRFSQTQGVAVRVGGHAFSLPASHTGQSLRVTVGP